MRRLLYSGLFSVMAAASSAYGQSYTDGNVTYNLNGRVYGFITAAGDQDQTYGAFETLRLYPSFDGITASGVKFGALADLRESAGTGPDNLRAGQIYSRRLYAYIGTSTLGTIRAGTTDGASSVYQVGTFDVGAAMFNDGGWNGIAHYNFAAAANPAWPFASSRFYAATNKILYLSPRFGGVDIAASYEPNVLGANLNSGGHYNANDNSDFLDAENIQNNGAERHNTFDGIVRYVHLFGDVAAIGTAGYVTSGKENAPDAMGIRYQGLNFGDLGASVSYAGITLAGNIQRGQFNGAWQLSPQGAKDSTAYSFGSSYKIGPYALGVSYFNYRSPGDIDTSTVMGERLEQGISAGGSYVFSKNVSFYVDYLMGERHQPGYDFVAGSADSGQFNNVHTQGITLGGRFSW
jgi:hypothetical protein